MLSFIPELPATRIAPFTRIERERRLPVPGDVTTSRGTRVDALDVIARAKPPKVRRALSLTRVLGVREADVPRHLVKQIGDTVDARDIIISKPINLGLQQLVYRAPDAGQITTIQGSWMILDVQGDALELPALYRGTVLKIVPGYGAVIRAQGALIQAVWSSGKENYGVLKVMAHTPDDKLGPEGVDMSARGAILMAGAGVTEAALRRADTMQAHGIITGGFDPRLREYAETLKLTIIVTEGFGRIPMSAPIFEWLTALNGQEAAVTSPSAVAARRGERPEIFVPLVAGRLQHLDSPTELNQLQVKPGARVRALLEPELGRIGVLPRELDLVWVPTPGGVQLPGVEIEWQDAPGEHATIAWANLELIG